MTTRMHLGNAPSIEVPDSRRSRVPIETVRVPPVTGLCDPLTRRRVVQRRAGVGPSPAAADRLFCAA